MNQRSREVVKIFKDELAKTVCAHYCRHIGSISLKRPIQLDFRLVQNVVRAIFVFGTFKSEQVEIYLILQPCFHIVVIVVIPPAIIGDGITIF